MLPVKRATHLTTLEPQTREDFAPGEGRSLDLEDLFSILRRRKLALILPMLVSFAAIALWAWSLPEVFRSTATILIEQQEIPTDLVASTVQSYADERIQTITQRVVTTDNIKQLIDRFDLFADVREVTSVDELADRVRSQFSVRRVRAGRGVIAFNVSYESPSASEAQIVASELASLYLEENLKTRMESAADTTLFLKGEAERLADEISEVESRIAAFKQQHMGRLPEQLNLNLQLMARTERELERTEDQIRALEERRLYLQSAMSQLLATSQGPAYQISNQLKALRTQLRGMLAIYTPDHPDVTRLRAEISWLEAQQLSGEEPQSLQSKLDALEKELAEASSRYMPEHPDIKRLKQQISDLRGVLAERDRKSNTLSVDEFLPPGYVDLESQFTRAAREIEALQTKKDELQKELAKLEDRIIEIPEIEREYSVLLRDRGNLLAKYREIRSKMSGARVAENLEKARKGERFTLIEPARLPLKPFKPNRQKILKRAFVASIGLGFATVFIAEFLQKAVHGVRGVTALLGAPPLAVIPYIENSRDRRRRMMRWIIITLLVLMTVFGLAWFAHIGIIPLQSLWDSVVANIESYWAALASYVNEIRNTI